MVLHDPVSTEDQEDQTRKLFAIVSYKATATRGTKGDSPKWSQNGPADHVLLLNLVYKTSLVKDCQRTDLVGSWNL